MNTHSILITTCLGTKKQLNKDEERQLDGRVLERVDRAKAWHVNIKPHESCGPTIEYVGRKEWWTNGKWHRLDGPAIVEADGSREWWVNGHNVTEVEQWIKENDFSYPFDKQTQVLFKLRFT